MTVYRCKECGESIDGFGAFGVHRAQHRRAARGDAPLQVRSARLRSSQRRRIETAGQAAAEPIDDDSGPAPADSVRSGPARSAPSVEQPRINVTPEQRAASVGDVVRDALPVTTLAELIRAISVAISEADGAGEAGYLSPIQCTQVASLLHETTVQFVIDRFGGDVNRFKAGLAVLLILIGKGGVHARAIGARISERRQRIAAPNVAAATIDATSEDAPTPITTRRMVAEAPQPAGLGDAMKRQPAAFAGTPGNAE